MECVFRDGGGRRWALCLRLLDQGRELIADCDMRSLPYCPQRREDGGTPALMEGCSCGGGHGSVRAALLCEARSAAERIIAGEDVPFPPLTPRLRMSLWPKLRAMVLERDGGRCSCCGADLSPRPGWLVEVHHVVPRRLGGSEDPRNLKTLCSDCHRPRTELLMRSIAPSGAEERTEAELRRKFRGGRDILASLIADGPDQG